MVNLAVGTRVIARRHHVEHAVVLAVLERCVDAYVVAVGHHALSNLLLVELRSFRKLRN